MSPVQKLSCGFLRLPVASVFTVDIFVLCATHDPQINTSYQQNPGSKHPSGGKMSTGLLASVLWVCILIAVRCQRQPSSFRAGKGSFRPGASVPGARLQADVWVQCQQQGFPGSFVSVERPRPGIHRPINAERVY